MKNIEVTVDINYNCNMNCSFCSTAPRLTPLQMSDNTADKCLDFLKRLNNRGGVALVISGGEPLLSDKLEAFLKTWGTVSDEIILCTNGTISKSRKYWRRLYSYGLRSIRLSLHGVSEENSKLIFGPAYSLATVKKTIDYVSQEQVAIDINYVLTQINIDQLETVFKFCSKNNIRSLRILGLARQGRAEKNWESLSLSEGCCKDVVAKAREMSLGYGVDVKFAGLSKMNIAMS